MLKTLRSGAIAEEGIDATLLQHVSPIEWDNVILYGQGRSSIVPGCAKERVLLLYFNTNVGATLWTAAGRSGGRRCLRGKGGGWCWLWGCLGPCEGAGREPFGHTSRLEL